MEFYGFLIYDHCLFGHQRSNLCFNAFFSPSSPPSLLHSPQLHLRAKGTTMGSQCQSASCWLICNNRLITAFPPSFPLHPAEQGSRPDLLAPKQPSCLPSATYYSLRSMFSLGEDSAYSSLVWRHWTIRQGQTQADSDVASSETSSSSSAPPYLLLQPPRRRGSSQHSGHVIWG